MKDVILQCFITYPDKKSAEKTIDILLRKNLIACGQIAGTIKSKYRWEKNIETAKEILVIVKTRKSLWKNFTKTIKENHPYKVPEIIGIKSEKVDNDYLKWFFENTGGENV